MATEANCQEDSKDALVPREASVVIDVVAGRPSHLLWSGRSHSACLLGKAVEGCLAQEVFQGLVQLVVAPLGGLVSAVINSLDRAREDRQQAKERLRTFCADLVTTYNEVKAVRRRLRAEGFGRDSTPWHEQQDAKALSQNCGAVSGKADRREREAPRKLSRRPDPEASPIYRTYSILGAVLEMGAQW